MKHGSKVTRELPLHESDSSGLGPCIYIYTFSQNRSYTQVLTKFVLFRPHTLYNPCSAAPSCDFRKHLYVHSFL
jgi:hypothetical protein